MASTFLKKIVSTAAAPKALGPYSQAVKVGKTVYLSGQIGIVPETGDLVTGSVQDETRQVLNNLKSVLEAADSSLGNVVKSTVFLLNLNDYQEVNRIYAEYFTLDPPARSAVQVAALPRGARVEIEAIAISNN